MKFYVYGLACPRTGDLRYVGYTNNPHVRLGAHCTGWGAPLVARWVRRIRRRPRMVILHECGSRAEARRLEKVEIAALVRAGGPVLNEQRRPDRPQAYLLHRQHGPFLSTGWGCKICEGVRMAAVHEAVRLYRLAQIQRATLDTVRQAG